MSDTDSAIKAAREVQADTLAPDLYREATEWFFRARKEYKLKNFQLAKSYAERARKMAEQSEFEAIRNGGARQDMSTKAPTLDTASQGKVNENATTSEPTEQEQLAPPSGTVYQEAAPPANPATSPFPTPKP